MGIRRAAQYKTVKKSPQLLGLVLVIFTALFIVSGNNLLTGGSFTATAIDALLPHPNYNRNVEATVRSFFIEHDAPEMIEIIECESNFRSCRCVQ